ncbi:MAG: hypothetical protein QOE07_1966 [Acidimicrobiaceae bacterium]|jgi:hypothetical protein|nr:hypothetical protein [Acidimicrobiaceae bacterium]MDQ1376020.1 hypothetical protein [Acidimicrobiaceae bacterium]MDQ1413378.1 hypothetical protein [Acidimicrobiaceae bacterium]MDQ1415758.1 hypothetical protein [Acidimicrobiaceae bacterium]
MLVSADAAGAVNIWSRPAPTAVPAKAPSPLAYADKEHVAATDAYKAAEAEYRDDPNIEIVLIGADSLSTVERTHGHYFGHEDRLARYFTAV